MKKRLNYNLKIAISTDGDEVCPHFGRAPQFTIITIENNELIEKKVVSNPGHTVGSIPNFINAQGATCMIAGGMGNRAIQFFNQYGIEHADDMSGLIFEMYYRKMTGRPLEFDKAVEKYKDYWKEEGS